MPLDLLDDGLLSLFRDDDDEEEEDDVELSDCFARLVCPVRLARAVLDVKKQLNSIDTTIKNVIRLIGRKRKGIFLDFACMLPLEIERKVRLKEFLL